jgi:NADH-quinone oxidoreductase subunit N
VTSYIFDLSTVAWEVITPALIVGAGSLVVLAVSLVPHERAARLPAALSLLFVVVAIAVLLPLWPAGDAFCFGEALARDHLATYLQIVVLVTTALTIFLSIGQLPAEGIAFKEYYALILLSTCGMMLLVSSNDLLMIFLGVELAAIPTYILAGMARGKLRSNEAALKYFLLGAFAAGFLLYGIALLYGGTGTTTLSEMAVLVPRGVVSDAFVWAGIALVVVGLGFKVALAPFHFWAPDVYEGAPTPVTAFIAAGPKAALYAPLIRIFLVAFPVLHDKWAAMLWVVAVLTMTVGNVVAIAQRDIKRMLAYSSIAHAGYILVGIIAGGEAGIRAIVFYVVVYVLATLGAFATVIALSRGEGPSSRGGAVEIGDYGGLGFKRPLLGIAMTLFMISLAGIPPAAGFLGKFYLFSAAVKAGFVGLAVIGVLNSVVSVYYYLRIVVIMYMGEATEAEHPARPGLEWVSAALAITAIATLWLGVYPSFVLSSATRALPQLFTLGM